MSVCLAAPLPQETSAHQAAMQALLGGMQLGAVARATPVREVEAQPDVEVARLWFVRVPKAAANDALTKQLHEQFQSHVEIVRKMNQKLGAKRETIKGLRSQMTEVRSVKGAAQPEFDDKLNRLKQLREQRNTCQARISDIRGLVKGLDCKTEAELDERLKREEEKIRFGAASLREEKQVLAELSKLRGQREKIKAYEQQKGSLVGLEAELAKIKAQIDDQDGEFSMVKGERDAASKVATGLYAKLKAVEKELEAEVAQQKEAVEKKDKVLAQLEAAKQEAEASQGDYRDNRKFSLSIREMLDRGEVEQARELCVQQTDSMMAKLSANKGMWEDYCRALAEQRKSFVSDLLPESSTAAKAAAATAAEATKAAAVQPVKKANSGKAVAAAPVVAVKPVADGAGKAKDLIASIMLQARAEAERAVKAGADAASELGSEGTSEDATSEEKSKLAPAPTVPKASAPAVAPKFVNNPAAKAAEVFGFKMEVPKVVDVEMLPLPAKVEQEAKSKNEVREEQRVKATEAEVRKAKRQEGLKKKKAKALVAQSKAKEEQDLANARAAAAAAAAEAEAAEKAKEAAAAQAAVAVDAELATDVLAGPAAAVTTASKVKKGKAAVTALDKVVAKLEVPAAKRPAAKANMVRQAKKLYVEHQKLMVLLACLVLFVAMLMIASM